MKTLTTRQMNDVTKTMTKPAPIPSATHEQNKINPTTTDTHPKQQ